MCKAVFSHSDEAAQEAITDMPPRSEENLCTRTLELLIQDTLPISKAIGVHVFGPTGVYISRVIIIM